MHPNTLSFTLLIMGIIKSSSFCRGILTNLEKNDIIPIIIKQKPLLCKTYHSCIPATRATFQSLSE